MCQVCMGLFGYVCSAFCQARAEKLNIDVPVYAGQNSRVEAKYWRKVKLASGAAVALLLLLAGAYVWYYFVGSRPRVLYSLKFPPSEYGNFAKLMGKDQVLLRRGNQLSRYDLRADKSVWSVPLVDKEQVAKAAQAALVEQKAQMAMWKAERAKRKARGQLDEDDDGSEIMEKPVSDEERLRSIGKWVENSLVSRVHLQLEGQKIWLISPSKAVQYDWESGKPDKEVAISFELARVLPGMDKSVLLMSDKRTSRQTVARLDLGSGELKAEQLGEDLQPVKPASGSPKIASTKAPSSNVPLATLASIKQVKGLPTGSATSNTTQKIAAVKPSPTRRVLMDDDGDPLPAISGDMSGAPLDETRSGTFMVFAGDNVAEMEVKVLQKNFVQYKAFKDKPKVSELDKGVNAANAVAAMSEIMNDLQADLTGGMRTEDESRYQVTIKRLLAAGTPEWSGEVVGPPALFSLKTVDVLTAGKAVYVFDKTNRKLWEGKLGFPVGPEMLGDTSWFEDRPINRSPCVEREQTLYLFDQGVLTSYELTSGSVRWRLPTVGISALHFDDKGMLYVSTSSAGAESLKYTKQIDLSKRVAPVIMKADPATGKILWKMNKMGSDIYFSGKYLYTIEDVPAGGMRIYRLKPGTGEPMWEHYEKRYTTKREFQENVIQLLHDDELKVLGFLSL